MSLLRQLLFIGLLTSAAIPAYSCHLQETQVSPFYQMFHPQRELLFEGEYGNVRGLRIDSMWVEDDVHYYFNQNIHSDQDFGGCATPYGPSWSGRKVIARENGDHIFFNRQGDSILFKTSANPGEDWRCYEGSDYIINAWVGGCDTMSFLGVLDSVKTIRFQVYDQQLGEVDIELNQMSVVLSKNHGVITMVNFYLFPDLEEFTYDYWEDELTSYNIAGMTSPKLGLQNFGWGEIFNFEIGDEFHILEEDRTINSIGPSSFRETSQRRQTILKVIEASYAEDELSYVYDRRESFREKVDENSPEYTYTHDTISKSYQFEAKLGYFPDEPIIENGWASAVKMTNGLLPSKTVLNAAGITGSPGDSCWGQVVFCGCSLDRNYYPGLGGPYGSCTGGLGSFSSISIDLVYYAKSRGTWGSPLIFTGSEKDEVKTRLRIYPNPAQEHITISCDQNISGVQIIDNSGRVVLSKEGYNSEQVISLDGLQPGMYHIGVHVEGGVQWEKIIVCPN